MFKNNNATLGKLLTQNNKNRQIMCAHNNINNIDICYLKSSRDEPGTFFVLGDSLSTLVQCCLLVELKNQQLIWTIIARSIDWSTVA